MAGGSGSYTVNDTAPQAKIFPSLGLPHPVNFFRGPKMPPGGKLRYRPASSSKPRTNFYTAKTPQTEADVQNIFKARERRERRLQAREANRVRSLSGVTA